MAAAGNVHVIAAAATGNVLITVGMVRGVIFLGMDNLVFVAFGFSKHQGSFWFGLKQGFKVEATNWFTTLVQGGICFHSVKITLE